MQTLLSRLIQIILYDFLSVQVIKGLDQGIFGGEGVPPMHVGMKFKHGR